MTTPTPTPTSTSTSTPTPTPTPTPSPNSRYWSKGIAQLKPYVPGEQPQTTGWIKLNTNELPYPPSPLALQAIHAATSDALRLYPDPQAQALKDSIAQHFGLTQAQVFVGNGSDEVLAHAFFGLLQHELPILMPDIGYSFYPVYCALYGIAYNQVPLTPAFEVNPADYAIPCGGVVIANPNAPTGVALSLPRLRELLQHCRDRVVVVDEAYVDFGAESAVALIAEFDNLLVVQTLSKSRALAGLRVGFALGHADLIEALHRVKDSFNSYPLDRLAQVGAVAALQDHDYFLHITRSTMQSRQWLCAALAELGFVTLPSHTNFVFTRHPKHAAPWLLAELRQRRILVRHFTQARIADYLRISIGSQAECEALVAALQDIVEK